MPEQNHESAPEQPMQLIEVVETDEFAVVIGSVESGRLWGIAINKEGGKEVIGVTELEAPVDGR
jgi:hypothetical protein